MTWSSKSYRCLLNKQNHLIVETFFSFLRQIQFNWTIWNKYISGQDVWAGVVLGDGVDEGQTRESSGQRSRSRRKVREGISRRRFRRFRRRNVERKILVFFGWIKSNWKLFWSDNKNCNIATLWFRFYFQT